MLRSAAVPAAPRRLGLRVVAALAAVALGLLGATLTVAPAQATSGFTGSLVDQLNEPVLGLQFIIHENDGTPSGVDHHVTSDPTTGDFSLTGLADGQYYLIIGDNPITGAYTDLHGDSYKNFGGSFYFLPGNETLGQIVLEKKVDVSGTITNWTSGMGNITVQVKSQSSGFSTVATGTSTGATFSIPTALEAGKYTLYFQLDPTSTSPFLDAFLGGEFFDPAAAAFVVATAGVPLTGITMNMPDAAFISGTVTDTTTGLGIPGIDITTEDRPDELFFAEDFTDADGAYSLRVVPGLTYAVYADDPNSTYASLTYQNLDPCGCTFTPVQSTYAAPAVGIDFELVPDSSAVFIEGQVFDDALSSSPSPFDNVQIHLYRPVTGGWAEVDVTASDSAGQFELALPAFGSYRLRFEYGGVWLPAIDGFAAVGSASVPDPISGCYVDTGVLDASSVDTHVAYYLVAGLNQAGGCAAEPTPSSSTGGNSSTGHRSGHPVAAAAVSTTASPTPTPTATPTPTPTPSASQPGDSVSTPKPTTPAPAGFDLTWLWILLAIIVALVVAFFVIRFLRGRRP